jgi:hypothetical protein
MRSVKIVAFLMLLGSAVFAQDTAQKTARTVTQTMDLVVEVPKLNTESYNGLKGKLNKIQNMSVEGFCNSQKLLYLRFSPDQYFNVLVAINEAGYPYYIKRNTTITKGMDACADKNQLYLKESRNE